MEVLTIAFPRAVPLALGIATAGLLLLLFLLLVLFLFFPLRFGFRLRWDARRQAFSWKVRLRLPLVGYVSYGRHQKVSDLLSGKGTDLQPALSLSSRRPHRMRRWLWERLRRLARRAARLTAAHPGAGGGSPFQSHTAAEGWETVNLLLRTLRRLHLRVRFGTGDAAATALLYGAAWAALGQLPINWHLTRPGDSRFRHDDNRRPARPAVELRPDFSPGGGILAVCCIGEVRPGQIIFALTQYWAKARRRGRRFRHLWRRAGRHAVGYRRETSHG